MYKFFDKTDLSVFVVTVFSLIYVIFGLFPIEHLASYMRWPTVYQLLHPLSFSILAAGIFYFFTIYTDKRHKYRWTTKFITYRLRRLNFNGRQVLSDIYSAKNMEISRDRFPSMDELKAVCSGISLMSIPPQTTYWYPGHNFKNWYEYFQYFFEREAAYANSFLLVNSLMPIHLVAIIDYLLRKPFASALHQHENSGGQYDDMGGLAGVLWSYLNIITHTGMKNEDISKFAMRAVF